jgi:hypothetical protein
MRARTLVATAVAAAAATTAAPDRAEADVGLGLFLGEPLGLTVLFELKETTALEVLVGADDFDGGKGRDGYAHVTFLFTPFATHADSVDIPFRIGIGAAAYHWDDDDLDLAARVPFQVAFQFHSAPIELYLEISLAVELVDDPGRLDVGAGVGFRIYL